MKSLHTKLIVRRLNFSTCDVEESNDHMVSNSHFHHYFNYIVVTSAPIDVCLEFLFTSSMQVVCTNILSRPMAAFPHNHHQNGGPQLERNGNPVTMTIINKFAAPGFEPTTSSLPALYATYWAMQARPTSDILKTLNLKLCVVLLA